MYSGLVLAVRDRDLAREAANEAFARAWGRRERVLRMEHPRAWVAKVGFNYALKRLKAREVPVDEPPAPQSAVMDPGGGIELRDQLRGFSPSSALAGVPSLSCGTTWTSQRGTQRVSCEDLGELRPSDLPILHVDGLQDGLVEATTDRGTRLEVRGVAVPGEPDGHAKDFLPAREVLLRDVEL
ncbi:MAG: hypothetical protein L0206_03180 [Actinobacteria bacterium]|nr:hypothetical protein [Actinomycetota bacterium]